MRINWKTFATIGTIIACITGYLTLKDLCVHRFEKYLYNRIQYYDDNIKTKWTSKFIRIGLYYQKNEDSEWELWYRHTDRKRYLPIYSPDHDRYYIIVDNESLWCE